MTEHDRARLPPQDIQKTKGPDGEEWGGFYVHYCVNCVVFTHGMTLNEAFVKIKLALPQARQGGKRACDLKAAKEYIAGKEEYTGLSAEGKRAICIDMIAAKSEIPKISHQLQLDLKFLSFFDFRTLLQCLD